MGVTTDAILFYGFELKDEDGEEVGDLDYFLTGSEEECNWEELVEEKTGKTYQDWDVKFDCHCSDSYPIWYICINSAGKGAKRGYAVEITSATLQVDKCQAWSARLKAFCDAMGIECHSSAWLLVSWWG